MKAFVKYYTYCSCESTDKKIVDEWCDIEKEDNNGNYKITSGKYEGFHIKIGEFLTLKQLRKDKLINIMEDEDL